MYIKIHCDKAALCRTFSARYVRTSTLKVIRSWTLNHAVKADQCISQTVMCSSVLTCYLSSETETRTLGQTDRHTFYSTYCISRGKIKICMLLMVYYLHGFHSNDIIVMTSFVFRKKMSFSWYGTHVLRTYMAWLVTCRSRWTRPETTCLHPFCLVLHLGLYDP